MTALGFPAMAAWRPVAVSTVEMNEPETELGQLWDNCGTFNPLHDFVTCSR